MTLFGHNITSYWVFFLLLIFLITYLLPTFAPSLYLYTLSWSCNEEQSSLGDEQSIVIVILVKQNPLQHSIVCLIVVRLDCFSLFSSTSTLKIYIRFIDLKTYQLPMHLYRVQQPNRHFSTMSHYTEYINWHYL